MSTTNGATRRRRTIEPTRMTRTMRVQLPADLDARLRELSDRYGVASGTIAREAIVAGLRSVAERLRRAARSAAREAGK